MRDYWNNRVFRIGAIIGMVGCGPLLLIVLLDAIGILSDSNPIGPDMLAFLSFWPALICMIIGAVQVQTQRK